MAVEMHPRGYAGIITASPAISRMFRGMASISQQGQTGVVVARSHLTDIAPLGSDERSRLRRRAVDRHRHQPMLDEASIFGAGGQFLTDVAALVPVDAVQLVDPSSSKIDFSSSRSRLPSGTPRPRRIPSYASNPTSRKPAATSADRASSRGRMQRAPRAVSRGSTKTTPDQRFQRFRARLEVPGQ